MTDFQLGLVLIGAVAIAGVLVYNRLQERSARRQGEKNFSSRHADVLLESEPARREPTFVPPAPAPAAAGQAGSVAKPAGLPDARIDYVIDVAFPHPVPAAAWLESWRPFERRSRQRVLVAGSEEGTTWEPIEVDPHRAWSRYRAGMQLASRKGMAAEGELLEFRSLIEGITAGLSGTVEPTDVRQAIEKAHELDRFCADSDIQVAFHLIPGDAAGFPQDVVQQQSASAGLDGDPGTGYRLQDARRETLFNMSAEPVQEGSVGRLTFSLDVPRVTDVRRSYLQMVSCAQQLRSLLGGTVVDDNGTALDERALEAIGRSLEPVRESLDKSGIAPGSAVALRLFS